MFKLVFGIAKNVVLSRIVNTLRYASHQPDYLNVSVVKNVVMFLGQRIAIIQMILNIAMIVKIVNSVLTAMNAMDASDAPRSLLRTTSESNIISENSSVLKYGSCFPDSSRISGYIITGPTVKSLIVSSKLNRYQDGK